MAGTRPQAPPGWGAPAAVAETHCAVVVFVADRAYKVKKPVSLGFVDFTDVAVRRAVLHRELLLNRRLAPDVYLGVSELVDEQGRAEPVLVMRRLPAERSLERLVREGHPDLPARVREVARAVAAFHAGAATSPEIARTGTAAFLRGLWDEGLAQQERFVGTLLDRAVHERTGLLARRWLDGRATLLDERVRDGRVRDGHGDLLAADVYCLDDGPRVLDCIEFDDRLRHGDVLLDVAFLVMDLERLGRPDLGRQLLADWVEFTGESHSPSLAEHHVAYRAHVRSKVACLRAEQGGELAAEEARRLARLCLDHLERARVRLVLVGGAPGTGKSTVAAGVADADGWLLVRSDEVRKAAAGLRPEERAPAPFGTGLYAPARTDQVYAELLARAEAALARGESVVLDASWTSAAWRDRAARVAARTTSDLVELRCTAPVETVRRRLADRARDGSDASDADADVAAVLAASADPWPAASVLDTDRPVEQVLAAARAEVGPQPGAPVSPATAAATRRAAPRRRPCRSTRP